MKLTVFSYGSLIDEPEHPERLRRCRLAHWPDHERVFHLRSAYRGCARRHAAFPHIEEGSFVRGDQRDSLVLGTRERPGHALSGACLDFEDPDGSTLAALDRREGYDPTSPDTSPYLRIRSSIHVGGRTQDAWVYITHPDHPRRIELPLEVQARILLHASPATAPAPGDRPRGAQYMLPLLRFLRGHDLEDPSLEALLAAMEAQVGPLSAYPHLWQGAELGLPNRPGMQARPRPNG